MIDYKNNKPQQDDERPSIFIISALGFLIVLSLVGFCFLPLLLKGLI